MRQKQLISCRNNTPNKNWTFNIESPNNLMESKKKYIGKYKARKIIFDK